MFKETVSMLKELHLPAIYTQLDELLREVEKSKMSHLEFLNFSLSRECEQRRNRKAEKMLRDANLPLGKSIENFGMDEISPKTRLQIQSLRTGLFLDRKENVLVFGKPGTGKTHLVTGLALEQVLHGRPVFFSTTALLVQNLLKAKLEYRLPALLRRLSKYEAIVLDDIGYVQHSREEMEVLFTFLADRYEYGSVLLTSNLPFSKWEQIFKDPMTTAAVIDRLVHHSIIIELNNASYRMKKAKEEKEQLKK